MKDSFYFPHDYNASEDEKMIKLVRIHGWAGAGLYWALIERLYQNGGRISQDYEMLAYRLRAEAGIIKAIVEDFQLFVFTDGMVGSASVDRRMDERRERQEAARMAGLASGIARRSERALNGRSTDLEPERKEKKERKEITTAPLAVDFSQHRLNLGTGSIYHKAFVVNVPVDECAFLLERGRVNKQDAAALRWRIAQKQAEMTPAQRRAA